MEVTEESLTLPGNIRCYWGAYDSKTQRVLDAQDKVLNLIKAKVPEAHCTYFPVEGHYIVHAWGVSLSGYHASRGGALSEAYNKLYKGDSVDGNDSQTEG